MPTFGELKARLRKHGGLAKHWISHLERGQSVRVQLPSVCHDHRARTPKQQATYTYATVLLSFRQKVESPGLSKRRLCAFDWPKRRSACLGLSSFWRNDHITPQLPPSPSFTPSSPTAQTGHHGAPVAIGALCRCPMCHLLRRRPPSRRRTNGGRHPVGGARQEHADPLKKRTCRNK